eukprot:TRINITY_DN58159_c0_g1_i1.p1 TRINITY_DN58159_c0_g1~~TRINITY_DN58159_c0_g1_i1.p1  ORF type:complete len:467 (-),score=50.91 TRINITY_DN58159_c0_g1_i1:178-1509(-)
MADAVDDVKLELVEGDVRHDEQSRASGLDIFFACAEGSVERVKTLLAARADVNGRDYENRCPLHVAAGRGKSVKLVQLLLEARAEVNAFDCWGLSPLDQAKQADEFAIEKLLRTYGAKLHKRRLSNKSVRENWEIRRKEVSLGVELSRTLKSIVYRGNWTGIDVVAKFCLENTPGADLEEAEQELLHEIELLASVRHPDLVMFLGCCLKESPIMFITPYMPGGDLERYYRKKTETHYARWCPNLKTVTKWARQILRALHFLHTCSQPIIHRDLKPLNILLTDTMDAKVSDFGISKITAALREHTPEKVYVKNQSIRSTMGSVQSSYMMTGGVGSFRYMAPEVARHEEYSEKVDIFSFALILYFMSSGRQPFYDFRDPGEILRQYSAGDEPRPKASDCPAVLRPMMQRAWHVASESRPSAVELLHDIADVEHGGCSSSGSCTSM